MMPSPPHPPHQPPSPPDGADPPVDAGTDDDHDDTVREDPPRTGAADDPRDPSEPDEVETSRSGPPPAAAWVIAFIAVVVAGVGLGLYFLGTPPEERDRQEIVRVASDTLMNVTNWEAGELDRVRADLAEVGTEQLQQEATQILDELAEALAAAGAESSGDVLELIAEVDRDEGVAVGIVRQELRTAELGTETVACWGVRVVTIRVDGRWMAETLDIVGPGQCPAASG